MKDDVIIAGKKFYFLKLFNFEFTDLLIFDKMCVSNERKTISLMFQWAVFYQLKKFIYKSSVIILPKIVADKNT